MADEGHLVAAAVALCEQYERHSHAEFYYAMGPHQRREMAAAGKRPWRGVMTPAAVHLINVLEEMECYDAPDLLDEMASAALAG